MISFQDALTRVLERAQPGGVESVGLDETPGRVLAVDVRSDLDFPPFDKSAMDGFACRRDDLGRELEVVETLAAGRPPTRAVGAGQCARIMTGAMLPAGADTVVMVEQTAAVGPERIRFTGTATAPNLCRRGEDLRAGDLVLASGTLLAPRHVPVLASVGAVSVSVAHRPRVGVLATGDELVDAARRPGPAGIRNSNSPQLAAQARAAGCLATDYGIAADTPDAIAALLGRALADNDVVLVSGGVSMGDFDFVPEAMRRCGLAILFDRVAVKPGRPTTFAAAGPKACFGLPGNPVSTYVLFEVMVKTFLLAQQGHAWRPPRVRVPLAVELHRRASDRLEWLPVRLTPEGAAAPVPYHGSGHFHALAAADGLLAVPAEGALLTPGTPVDVRLL